MEKPRPAMDVAGLARRLAEDVLFPAALETDRSDLVPRDRLDMLAEAGLYGVAGPASAGGLGLDEAEIDAVVEALASGCLTTTFVWMQHHAAVRALAGAAPPLRDEWLTPLCRGLRRAGVAFSHLRRPGPPVITATRTGDGVRLDGTARWLTGWGRVDVIHLAARDGDDVVWTLVDAEAGPSLTVEPLHLAAVNASGTATLQLRGHVVPAHRIVAVEPYAEWSARDATRLRRNGFLALGVAARCVALLDGGALATELGECRDRLRSASPEETPAARAGASDLAIRAATALVAASGGRAVLLTEHAQRLMREAMFLLVFGQTPAIRAAQAERYRLPG